MKNSSRQMFGSTAYPNVSAIGASNMSTLASFFMLHLHQDFHRFHDSDCPERGQGGFGEQVIDRKENSLVFFPSSYGEAIEIRARGDRSKLLARRLALSPLGVRSHGACRRPGERTFAHAVSRDDHLPLRASLRRGFAFGNGTLRLLRVSTWARPRPFGDGGNGSATAGPRACRVVVLHPKHPLFAGGSRYPFPSFWDPSAPMRLTGVTALA